jgi:light-regulated signal transduction histidine kinase (bacteriophytochrome)
MESAANRMQTLLASLFQYSRVAASANHFKETDLTAVANGVLGDLEDAVKRAEARVEIGDLPVIQADADQMHRLFQNLIGNGLKYRRDMEKPIVKVWSTIEGKYCKIFIEDNGIGFEEKYLDRIFKPFQRLHGRNSPYDGTGIGLAICRKIVEYHRGMITAKSIPGAGSTFIVHLPLRNNDLEELPAVPAAEKHRQNRDPALGLGVIRHPEKPL